MQTKKNKGISLIVLIITIVVIIILATAIIVNLAKSNIIENTNESVVKQDFKTLQDELNIYMGDKYLKTSGKFDISTFNADSSTDPSIYDVLSSLKKSKYREYVTIVNGKITISESMKEPEKTWIKEILNITESKIEIPEKFYTIIFNSNSGTGQMPIKYVAINENIKLPKSNFSLEGYEFAGWAIQENGEIKYDDMQEIYNIANEGETITLYARYKHVHSDNCYTSSVQEVKATGDFGSKVYSLYNIYEDKECTILISNDYKFSISGGTTNVFPIKVIDYATSNTYYINGINDGTNKTTNLYHFVCPQCHMSVATSSRSDKIYHNCSEVICGFVEGLK